MEENEEISATGQFTPLAPVDFASSYHAPKDATSPPPAATTAQPGQPSAQEIQAAVDRANANLASSNRVMEFRVDAATGLSVAMIRDTQTGEVLQQIPGANIIALARMLASWSPGKHMLLDLIA